MKPVIWTGTSHGALLEFNEAARKEAGYQLFRVQTGLDPSDWKPMTTIGSGVREIRIHEKDEFRIMYIASFDDAVYVLHAFQKKTRKTAKSDLDLATIRLRKLLQTRKEKNQ